MNRIRNPNRKDNFFIDGYKDLGWQNGWKAKYVEVEGKKKFDGYENQPEFEDCRKLKHNRREIDN